MYSGLFGGLCTKYAFTPATHSASMSSNYALATSNSSASVTSSAVISVPTSSSSTPGSGTAVATTTTDELCWGVLIPRGVYGKHRTLIERARFYETKLSSLFFAFPIEIACK